MEKLNFLLCILTAQLDGVLFSKLGCQQLLHRHDCLEGLWLGNNSRLLDLTLGQVSIRVLIVIFKTSHDFDSVGLDLFGVNLPGSSLLHQAGTHLTILCDVQGEHDDLNDEELEALHHELVAPVYIVNTKDAGDHANQLDDEEVEEASNIQWSEELVWISEWCIESLGTAEL